MVVELFRFVADRILYRPGYFRMVDATSGRCAPAMAQSICDRFSPRRVIDYGCGTGSLLAALRNLGVEAAGTELSATARGYCNRKGLFVVPIDFRRSHRQLPLGSADVVTCLEVGEHVPKRNADDLVGLISATAPVIVFSAATPGQGGRGHVNEQPRSYWQNLFRLRGQVCDDYATVSLRAEWCGAGVESWYASNVLVFRKRQEGLP